jgi:uncharacterized protein YgfB (UPF0149 family)
MTDTVSMPDFEDLASVFWRLGALKSPSFVQGYLAGQLAVGSRVEADEWLLEASGLMEAVDKPAGEDSRLLLQMYSATLAQLEAAEMSFELVLPCDEVSLMDRTQCLGEWSQGFLTGFAMAGKQQQSEKGAREYSKDISEALSDLAAISQISMEDEEVGEDGGESDFFDVVEYVRLAAVNVFLECNQEQVASESYKNVLADDPDESISNAQSLFSKKLH